MGTTMSPSRMTVDELYEQKFAYAAERYAEALRIFPNGATHDGRAQSPFPIYIARAEGSRKWDLAGNEFVDFLVGHGALLLGHSHPEIVRAVTAQMERGTHYGAAHELEIAWGRLVQQLIPSAERVRFTSSGTEATLLALRLARAYTGKSKIVKFAHHFHGWHDYVEVEGAEEPLPSGVPEGTAHTMVVLPPNEPDILEATLRDDPDIAAVIIEPTGGSFSTYPLAPDFLPTVRHLTRRYSVLLIMDEVITGFRCAPGGVQAATGVIPDLTTLAKVLAGGLPGGAVVGRAEIFEYLAFKDDPAWNREKKIRHHGTFNANPLSAAAGTTALRIIAEGWPSRLVNDLAQRLRSELNAVIDSHHLSGCVYGTYSMFHVMPYNPDSPHEKLNPYDSSRPFRPLHEVNPVLHRKLRRGMQVHGIDLMRTGGMLSVAHTEEDIRRAADALDRTLGLLVREGAIPGAG